jgi:hypothetical protein
MKPSQNKKDIKEHVNHGKIYLCRYKADFYRDRYMRIVQTRLSNRL